MVVGSPDDGAAATDSTQAVAAEAPVAVSIGDGTLVPARIDVAPGQTIEWTNDGSSIQAVYEPGDAFDSGDLPPGGGFTAALPIGGSYTYRSTTGAEGTIVVGDLGFDAPDTDLVADHIVDMAYPPVAESDFVRHPTLGVDMHRTWLEVGFLPGTTVAEANAALTAAGTPIAGMIDRFDLVLVVAPATDDLSGLDAARRALKSQAGVEFAAPLAPGVPTAIPGPGPDTVARPFYSKEAPEPDLAWDRLADEPVGAGDNWHLEIGRLPAAWNAVDSIRAAANSVRTVVIDGALSPHDDLSMAIDILCTTTYPVACTSGPADPSKSGDHGNHVAGIIGADWNNVDPDDPDRRTGVNGVNPAADIVAYEVFNGALGNQDARQWDRLLELVDDGTHADLRVVNRSIGQVLDPEDYEPMIARGPVCGPGNDDDDLVDGEWCTMATDDDWRAHIEDLGRNTLRHAKELSDRGIVLVQAASNNGETFCNDALPFCVVDDAEWTSRWGWVAANWEPSDGPNPVVVAEGIGSYRPSGDANVPVPSTERLPESNVGGDVAAPAVTMSTCKGPDTYCYKTGTSMAAPFVAGVIGYMLALDPTMTIERIRTALIDSAIADTTDPDPDVQPAPRVDAFGALLHVEGAARALADMNDPSRDGNRRVAPAVEGEESSFVDTLRSTTEGWTSEPDGIIDMRDFRRFRDGWLQLCRTAESPECEVAYAAGLARPGTPQPDGTGLDGALNHPKRDLNGDGCIGPSGPCPAEHVYPRMDLNGDGVVSIETTAMLPPTFDGTTGGPLAMHDLGVMTSVWDGAAEWPANALPELMVSGDLSVDLSNAQALGALGGTITVLDGETAVTSSPISFAPTPDDDVTVLTVPAGGDHRVRMDIDYADGTQTTILPAPTLTPGGDGLVSLCRIDVDVSPSVVPPDGTSTATVTAQVENCDVDLAGASVDFVIQPTGTTSATITPESTVADTSGVATTTVTAGTERSNYAISVTYTVPGSDPPIELSGDARFIVNGYDTEVLATSSDASGYAILQGFEPGFGQSRDQFELFGPSINSAGEVAFQAQLAGSTFVPDVFVADGDEDPLAPASAANITTAHITVDSGLYVAGPVSIGDDGDVAARLHDMGSGSVETWIWLLDGSNIASPVEIHANAVDDNNPNDTFGYPSRGSDGVTVFGVELKSDQSDGTVDLGRIGVLDGVPPFDVTSGPISALTPLPFVAADGTMAAETLDDITDTGERILVGPSPLDGVQLVAGDPSEGWNTIGVPGIADTGDVVAFSGDRGNGPALWLTVRAENGAFTEPVAIEGNSGANLGGGLIDGAELIGFESPRSVRGLGTDRPVGVLHQRLGADGLADDVVVLAYLGTPAGGRFGSETGLWTTELRFITEPLDGDSAYRVDASEARYVRQLGDTWTSQDIVRIEIWDPIAAGVDDSPGSHRLAYAVQLANNDHHIFRATWTGADDPLQASSLTSDPVSSTDGDAGSPQGFAGTTASTRPTTHALAPTIDGAPVVVAFSVDDLTPAVGTEFTIVNRSRTLTGEPVAATLSFDDGTAATTIDADAAVRIDVTDGPLVVTLAIDGTAVSRTVVGAIPPNDPPIANAGGPYEVRSGDPLIVDATASTDPEGLGLDYAWDLDADGEHDDATGGVTVLSWATIDAAICGDSCTPGPHPISVQVTDVGGLTATASTTLTIDVVVPDFVVEITPASLPINDGQTVTFTVVVGSIGGFNDRVDLSVGTLPDGWSTRFGAAVVTPPTTTTLDLTAPTGATIEEQVPIEVIGTSGDVVRTTGTVADLVFGLIPICDNAGYRGRVVDAYTGQGLEGIGVSIRYSNPFEQWRRTTTDADGTYAFGDIGGNGLEIDAFFSADGSGAGEDGYWPAFRGDRVMHCDVEYVESDVVIYRELTALSATGQVFEEIKNPDGSRTLTGIPIEGARVASVGVVEGSSSFTTGTDGRYLFEGIRLGDNNTPRIDGYRAGKDGYWSSAEIRPTFSIGSTVVHDFGLLRQCSAPVTIRGTVADQDGNPLENIRVTALGGTVSTDADGSFAFEPIDVLLARGNNPLTPTVTATRPVDWPSGSLNDSATVSIDQCDRPVDADLSFELYRAPEPVTYYGDLTGTITSTETGDPVPGVTVKASTGAAVTDASGAYLIEDLPFTSTEPPPITNSRIVTVTGGGWWRTSEEFEMTSGQTTVADLQVTPVKYGEIAGVVTDIATGEPLADAFVSWRSVRGSRGSMLTDEFGRYRTGDLDLRYDNQPESYTMEARRGRLLDDDGNVTQDGYYGESRNVVASADTETTADYQLVRICDGARITGTVVNAETGEPLSEATVRVSGDTDDGRVLTDQSGFFELTGVRPDTGNEPGTVVVTASKFGFVTAEKTIDVWCGASLFVPFGEVPGGFGSVIGTVTDDTGAPLEGVVVGGQWGAVATTAADGTYELTGAPLSPEGTAREWDVSAVRGEQGQTEPVLFRPGDPAVRDFVFPSNRPPVAAFDQYRTDSNITLVIAADGLLGNDSDPDGDAISIESSTQPSGGSAIVNADGSFSYTPNADTCGDDTFTYTLGDGMLTDETTVLVTIACADEPPPVPNEPPVADAGGPYTGTIGEPVTLDGSGSTDPDGTIVAYEWDVDGDGQFDDATGVGPEITFTDDGTADIALRVIDDDGDTASDWALAEITPVTTVAPNPAIDLEVTVAGEDADTDGPVVAVGEELSWRFVITNTGNTALLDVGVNDDDLAATDIVCDAIGNDTDGDTTIDLLLPGEQVTCTAVDIAREDGGTARAEVTGSPAWPAGDADLSDPTTWPSDPADFTPATVDDQALPPATDEDPTVYTVRSSPPETSTTVAPTTTVVPATTRPAATNTPPTTSVPDVPLWPILPSTGTGIARALVVALLAVAVGMALRSVRRDRTTR